MEGLGKIALITGITGQDGSYLAEFLLSKGYIVHGIIRRGSTLNTGRIQHLFDNPKLDGRLHLHYGDLTDTPSLTRIISGIQPDEIYNLGAQSHVQVAYDLAEYTSNVDAVGVLRLLDAIRRCKLESKVRIFQASTAEVFGKVKESPQNEKTHFYPRTPYGIAKLYAHWAIVNYREGYDIFACNGILYNHESPRRGETFVTRKITHSVAKISLGLLDCFDLGYLDAKRDWGHAQDYVQAMWKMLQMDKPDDYVIATGEAHTVREFVEEAFREIGHEIEWEGKAMNEIGREKGTGIVRVKINPKFYRPCHDLLRGDIAKARTVLGWQPNTPFKDLVSDMVRSDIDLIKQGLKA